MSSWVAVRPAQGQLKSPQQCISNPVLQDPVLREQPLFSPAADLFQKHNNLCFIKWINQVPQECSSESFRIFPQEEQETFAREIEINRELEKKGIANC